RDRKKSEVVKHRYRKNARERQLGHQQRGRGGSDARQRRSIERPQRGIDGPSHADQVARSREKRSQCERSSSLNRRLKQARSKRIAFSRQLLGAKRPASDSKRRTASSRESALCSANSTPVGCGEGSARTISAAPPTANAIT